MKESPLEKIIEDCLNSDAEISLNLVTELYQTTLSVLYNDGDILKKVEEKIGKEDFNILFTSLTVSFLTTLYANAMFKDMDLEAFEEEFLNDKKSDDDIDGEC